MKISINYFFTLFLVLVTATRHYRKVSIQQPINPSMEISPATVESKMEETFTAPTVTSVDEEISNLADIVSHGTIDQLDDFIESRGEYAEFIGKDVNLLYYAAVHQKLDIFIHILEKGFSVDSMIPGLNMPVYRFIITMKSTPIRDATLRIAYETSNRMLEDYYRPIFKKTGWDVDAAEAMKLNDFIYIDRILNRHKAHPHNVITNQGLMLHSAVLNDCPECVRLILKAGADPNHLYVGKALLKDCIIGQGVMKVDTWTPLMMAVAKGNMRVIDALLESPKIQVCKEAPADPFTTARGIARKWPRTDQKRELLKKLHARARDAPTLEKWLQGVALDHLNMKFALSLKSRRHVEFLLHNCIVDVDQELLKYAFSKSNTECFEILIAEFFQTANLAELESAVQSQDLEAVRKSDIIIMLANENKF